MDSAYVIRYVKHVAKKILRRPDPRWPFYDFEHRIDPRTCTQHQDVLSWAEKSLSQASALEAPEAYGLSTDPLVQQGYRLKQHVENVFRDKYAGKNKLRLLIQVPDAAVSPGGYSLLSNFAESFQFLGIPVHCFGLTDNVLTALETFNPTVLLVTDHEKFRDTIDWGLVATYRSNHNLLLGLSARLEEEEYGNSSLRPRLAWAQNHRVDFYFSYRDEEYIHTRKEYRPFFEQGYEILTIPFGANPLHYYPVPGIVRDIPYCLLASGTWTKGDTYRALAKKVISHYAGFIDGIGWQHVKHFHFNKDRDRYIYARSKIGLNFHLPEQLEWACEVNERTHQLALCGVPQLMDTPKLLSKLYSEDAFFACKDEKEFSMHFKEIMSDYRYGQERALKAQRQAFERHTTFHRAEAFIKQLESFLSAR